MSETIWSKSELKEIAKLKTYAFQLFKNKQITYKHYVLILEVEKHDKKYMQSLKVITEDLLRVKGYYCFDKRIDLANQILAEWLKQIQSK